MEGEGQVRMHQWDQIQQDVHTKLANGSTRNNPLPPHVQRRHHHLHRTSRDAGSRQLGEEEGLEGAEDEVSAEQEQVDPSEKVLLYGRLEVGIGKARNLPHTGPLSHHMPQCSSVFAACKFRTSKETDTRKSGIYAVLSLAGARLARTSVKKNASWNELFWLQVAHSTHEVLISIKEEGAFSPRIVGRVRIPARRLLSGEVVEGSFPVLGSRTKSPVKKGAEVEVSLKYLAVGKDTSYELEKGVPNVYFPMRRGCSAVLYQDAHVSEQPPEPIKLDNGSTYVRRKCWEELCQAILDAHHLVYVVGWAVYDKIKLVRGSSVSKDLPDVTIGELLKMKAAEGVRVLLLVWDDKTSHHNRFIKLKGVMGTHDEETRRYFKHSSVKCVLAPRYADSKLSWFRQKMIGTLYTHHQKMVLVDTPGPGNTRKITTFLGGLDLCDGRYDTQEHSIFNTLTTIHEGDCYNATFSITEESGGPRQPWHDQHSKIEGPASCDAYTNFEQRWRKSAKRKQDHLIQIARIRWILGPIKGNPEEDKALEVTTEDDPETWNVQIFRSIDSGSVEGFPRSVREARQQNLVSGKSIAIDKSIEMAYVERIRSAQHFIYIENQYFLGSSYAWPKYKNAGATHLIPMELALKIAAKIKAKERFAVYVVIPMWPEGDPESGSAQEILFFQSQTMEMMYRIVAEALRDAGLNEEFHPKDYLNFYCLGKREIRKEEPKNPPSEKSKQHRTQQSGRFMIYVHAKSMVVDDDYIILGSANINQRSLDGSRDTEIAMGAFQLHHTWSRKKTHPRGQIYGHRMSLWTEHLACYRDLFNDPAALETVREVNKLAQKNWEQYVAEEVTPMDGHLMPYPIQVNEDGTLQPLPGHECFPDVGGKIMGAPQMNLPDAATA